jgi:hypothetical protein
VSSVVWSWPCKLAMAGIQLPITPGNSAGHGSGVQGPVAPVADEEAESALAAP